MPPIPYLTNTRHHPLHLYLRGNNLAIPLPTTIFDRSSATTGTAGRRNLGSKTRPHLDEEASYCLLSWFIRCNLRLP